MKYYLIAGEASGDLHGSNLMKGLNAVDPQPDYRFWGGDLMHQQGGELARHYKEHNIMGFWEVIVNLPKIKKNLSECKQDILRFKPDVLILIDYPGFNLRIAEFAKKHNIRVFYYISPKIWAWKESRIKKIKAYVDKMFVIFPFEKEFYARHHFEAEFYGNPLIDAVQEKKENKDSFDWFVREHNLQKKPIIAILPGSRKQEIDRNLAVMMELIPYFRQYQFVIAGAPSIDPDYYKNYITDAHQISFVYNQTYDLLNHSYAAIVTSGTATLETALFDVPQVVCYRANRISYRIAKFFVSLDYISLVNLNMQEEVVKELIQDDMTPKNLKEELDHLLNNDVYRQRMLTKYKELKKLLGENKGVSKRVAEAVYHHLKV